MATIRKLLMAEKPKVADHLKRLDTADRIMRFETPASDDYIDRYVAGLRARTDILFGAFDDALVLRGFAHIALSGDLADLGLSVEAGQRGEGIGTKLLERAIAAARLAHAKTFSSQCLTHNRWMMGKMQAMGFTIERDCGTAVATTTLDPPSLRDVQESVFHEQLGWLDYNAKLIFSLVPFGR